MNLFSHFVAKSWHLVDRGMGPGGTGCTLHSLAIGLDWGGGLNHGPSPGYTPDFYIDFYFFRVILEMDFNVFVNYLIFVSSFRGRMNKTCESHTTIITSKKLTYSNISNAQFIKTCVLVTTAISVNMPTIQYKHRAAINTVSISQVLW